MDCKRGRQQVPPATVHLKFRRLCDPSFRHYQHCQQSLSATTTCTGKSRAPPCKYYFWFSHKQKTVTENTVVIHSFPKQTQISYLRNSRFSGPSIKITCLKLKLSSQNSEITDYKFLLYPFSPPCGKPFCTTKGISVPCKKTVYDQTTKNRNAGCPKQSLVLNNCHLTL